MYLECCVYRDQKKSSTHTKYTAQWLNENKNSTKCVWVTLARRVKTTKKKNCYFSVFGGLICVFYCGYLYCRHSRTHTQIERERHTQWVTEIRRKYKKLSQNLWNCKILFILATSSSSSSYFHFRSWKCISFFFLIVCMRVRVCVCVKHKCSVRVCRSCNRIRDRLEFKT